MEISKKVCLKHLYPDFFGKFSQFEVILWKSIRNFDVFSWVWIFYYIFHFPPPFFPFLPFLSFLCIFYIFFSFFMVQPRTILKFVSGSVCWDVLTQRSWYDFLMNDRFSFGSSDRHDIGSHPVQFDIFGLLLDQWTGARHWKPSINLQGIIFNFIFWKGRLQKKKKSETEAFGHG